MTIAAQAETMAAADPRAVPGPRGLPVLGVARELLVDPFNLIERCTVEYGGMVRLALPGRSAYLLSDPELVKYALLETERAVRKPPSMIKRVHLALGLGLVTSEGELWRRNRRIANPVFTKERLRAMAPQVRQAAQETVDRWRGRTVIDLKEEFSRTLLELVIRGLFDATSIDRFDEIAASLLELLRFTVKMFVSAMPPHMYFPTPTRIRAEYHRRRFDRIVAEMIGARRAAGVQHEDVLAFFMDAVDEHTGERLTTEEIADEVRTMFLAGYETTATALVFACRLVSEHPLVRERLEAELDAVLGGRMPGIDDLHKLPYTVQVFHEALRLYPPAWLIGREMAETAEVGGYLLPKGTLMFVSPWATHRSPHNWESPLSFDPDRFAPENRDRYHKFAFIPFGGGSRKCIGTNLAMLEGPLLLAAVAQHYRLEMLPGERLVMHGGVTLNVESGTRMSVRPRQRGLPG